MAISEIIKYEGDNNTLVWKHPVEDFNTTSQLIVHESQEAILFRNGQALDLFGAGRYTLETGNIPLLKHVINIPTGGKTPFHCEVYFINKAIPLNLKWGTSSQSEVQDPKFGVLLNIGASGAMGVQIENSRKFLVKLVGTERGITTERLTAYFRELIATRVKSYLTRIMSEVSFIVVNQYLNDISEALKSQLAIDMEEYGINLANFYLSTIHIPEGDKQRVKDVLNRQMEYGALGYNWVDEQIADIAKKYASNEGNQNNVGGMMAQIPVAFAFGQMLRSSTKPLMDQTFSGMPKAFSSATSGFQSPSPIKQASSALKPKVPEPIKKGSFCSKCGKELAHGDRFCSGCGNPVNTLVTCTNCGRELKGDDNFCPVCGTKKGGK